MTDMTKYQPLMLGTDRNFIYALTASEPHVNLFSFMVQRDNGILREDELAPISETIVRAVNSYDSLMACVRQGQHLLDILEHEGPHSSLFKACIEDFKVATKDATAPDVRAAGVGKDGG